MWPASETDLSSDFGKNMLTLVRRFSTKEVVFWIWAAVEMRLREQIRSGIIRAYKPSDLKCMEDGWLYEFLSDHPAHRYACDVQLSFRGPTNTIEDFEDVFSHLAG
jgi:hypothetical protein